MQTTKAWQRVKEDIERYAANPIEGPRVLAMRVNSTSEVSKVATRKQKAAARRNIKKAQAARRKKSRAKKTTKRTTRSVKKTVGPKRKRKTTRTTTTTTTKRRRKSPKKRKAAKRKTAKRRASSRTRTIRTERVRVIKVPSTPKASAIRLEMAKPRRKKSKSRKRRKNPTTAITRVENPPLVQNQMGPFTADAMRDYLVATGGVTAGLLVAEVIDRYVATRTPGESGLSKGGVQPWYGRDAAAAQQRRPDAMRLGVQAGGAVAAILGTYATRNVRFLPWLLGGTAVGFGVNLFMKLAQWYLLPAIFKVENSTEATLANRLFPLEQATVQDAIDNAFENWSTNTLAKSQLTEGVGIESPLGGAGGPGLYVLGKAPKGKTGPLGEAARNPAGRGELLMTGRVGSCNSCGGNNGCYSTCNDLFNGKAMKCRYVVQPGDDLSAMANAASVDITVINSLNGGQLPSAYWRPGSSVVLPYAMCKYINKGTPSVPRQPPSYYGTPVPHYPTDTNGGSSTPAMPEGNGNGGYGTPAMPEGNGGGETFDMFEGGAAEILDVSGTPQPQTQPQLKRGFNFDDSGDD